MAVNTPQAPTQTIDSAPTYKDKIDATIRVLMELAASFAPHEAAVPDMTVVLDAGKLFDGTNLTLVAQQTTTVITAPVTNPRIDRVVIDSLSGVYSIITGAENVSPTAPAITADTLPVCQILLAVAQTSILNTDMTDERVHGGGGGAAFNITDNSDANWLTVDVDENAAFVGNVSLGDNKFLYLGAGNDLNIYHGGSNSYMSNATGNVYFQELVNSGLYYFSAYNSVGVNKDCLVMGGTIPKVDFYFNGILCAETESGGLYAEHFSEGVKTDTTATTFVANLLEGSLFDVIMTGNVAISFSNVPVTTRAVTVTFVLTHSLAGRTPSFPASVKWDGGVAPTWGTAAGNEDIVTMFTYDGGTTWRANLVGQNYA